MANQKMKSTVTLKEGFQVEGKAREFKVVLDEPEQFGGNCHLSEKAIQISWNFESPFL